MHAEEHLSSRSQQLPGPGAGWSLSVAQPEQAGRPAGNQSIYVLNPIPTALLQSAVRFNHKHITSDKETDYGNVIKSTQMDAEWLAFHSKRRGRGRTENKMRVHRDSRRDGTRVPRKRNNTNAFSEELLENLGVSPGDH